MDKKRSVLNVSVSVASKFILMLAALIVRRLLIQKIGNDVNGLNSLYIDIIGMMGVAELGVGSAIVYSMYSPIVKGDKKKVSALFCLYKRLYRIIGTIILAAGILVTPFLPKIIGDYDSIDKSINVYLTFLLTVVSVVISYLYSAKSSLIEAHKDNYITTGITTLSKLFMYGLQIASVIIWRSFTVFALCKIAGSLFAWAVTEIAVRKKYKEILSVHESIDKETESEIVKNIKAMFMHKIGTILVNGVDSLIISIFIGVVILGKYNNYAYIAGVVSSTIALFFSPLTSVIGHLCTLKEASNTKRYFDYFYSLNFALGVIFFVGFYAVIDGLVALIFGEGLEISRPIVFIITMNHFTTYMRNASLLFRNASGTFYNDRWKPVAEGTVNIILSLLFVNILPEDLKIVGVIFATILTTLFICHIVEPYVIFRHVFESSPKPFYIRNYLYTVLFTVCLVVFPYIAKTLGLESNGIKGILLNGSLSLGVSVAALFIVAVIDKQFRNSVFTALKSIAGKIRAKA